MKLSDKKRASRAFRKAARENPSTTFWDWIHGVIYARQPYFYIGVATGEHPMARFFKSVYSVLSSFLIHPSGRKGKNTQKDMADGYHGKVISTENARHLVTLNKSIDLGDLEAVIPYSRARDLILKNPDHIAVMDCPCRAVRENPCLPLDVCLVIGEPFASYIVHHHPGRSRFITGEEAVRILEEEHARGHVHHAFFKDAMLGRFYAICNCCTCCCGAMQAWKHGVPMLASSGYEVQCDAAHCAACGVCARACPFEALKVSEGILDINKMKCMGCGVCVNVCCRGALKLVSAPERGVPLEVCTLIEKMQSG